LTAPCAENPGIAKLCQVRWLLTIKLLPILHRGLPGSISAAVINANQAVDDAEQRVQAKADGTYAKFATDLKALREEIKQLKQHLDECITNAVDHAAIQVLRDYHLLNENHEPTHWKKK
jgi:hypothetical protein